MEKVSQWCGQPSDRGQLKNRTERNKVYNIFDLATHEDSNQGSHTSMHAVKLSTQVTDICLYNIPNSPWLSNIMNRTAPTNHTNTPTRTTDFTKKTMNTWRHNGMTKMNYMNRKSELVSRSIGGCWANIKHTKLPYCYSVSIQQEKSKIRQKMPARYGTM